MKKVKRLRDNWKDFHASAGRSILAPELCYNEIAEDFVTIQWLNQFEDFDAMPL